MGEVVRRFEPTLNQLAPAVAWLRKRGVQTSRLAVAFRTTSDHVRVLAHRGRQTTTRMTSDTPVGQTAAILLEIEGQKPAFDVPPGDGSVESRTHRRFHVDELQHRMDVLWQRAGQEWQLLDATAQLKRLGYQLGRPESVRLLRLRARLRHHLSWCLVHSGRAHSAAVAALRAIQDARQAYRETLDPFDLQFIAQVALVASHSHLLRRQSAKAGAFLDLVQQASEAGRRALPADYFRQSGVSAFQRGDDERGRVAFERAARTLAEQEPNRTVLDLRFMSIRHTAAMHPVNWDTARMLLADVHDAFDFGDLQVSMMTHWVVAAGFTTDSPEATWQGLDLLAQVRLTASCFGHQATINHLLTLTPDLRLPSALQRDWIRWLLYANAYGQQ